MNDKNSDNPGSGERVCNRINLPRALLLELDNGDILRGQSVDLSPRGVLLKTETPPETGLLGLPVTLFIISAGGEFSIGYPGKVVRHNGSSVALEIHKNSAAAFGDYLTRDLLGYRHT